MTFRSTRIVCVTFKHNVIIKNGNYLSDYFLLFVVRQTKANPDVFFSSGIPMRRPRQRLVLIAKIFVGGFNKVERVKQGASLRIMIWHHII